MLGRPAVKWIERKSGIFNVDDFRGELRSVREILHAVGAFSRDFYCAAPDSAPYYAHSQ